MSESLYSSMEHAQFRGPAMSDNYNQRVEKAYRDLVMLLNKVGLADEDARIRFRNLVKNHFSLMKTLEELKSRVVALEDITELESGEEIAIYKLLTFFNSSVDDTNNFNGTEFEISSTSRCSIDTRHGVMTLPKINSSSMSKFGYSDNYGNFILPASFEARASGVIGTADAGSALISTSDVQNSAKDEPGKVWERNVTVSAPNIASGSEVSFYAKPPEDISATVNANAIVVHPYPMMGCELTGVYTSSQQVINLNDNDSYVPVNSSDYYSGINEAVGWVPPGAWNGDSIPSCGPKIFYFDPKEVNAVKLKIKQNDYYLENNKYTYTYGLSFFDLRYDSFLSAGKAILRFDAPTGKVINSVDNVTPNIYNVSEAELPYIFSYRAIWETAVAGVYTLDPQPASQSVWIEVTLSQTIGKGTPSLSGLKVEYS